jgi:hypothetical protein
MEAWGVGSGKVVGVHFNVCIEPLEMCRGIGSPPKKIRHVDIAQFGFNADFFPRLFDQRLEILTHS